MISDADQTLINLLQMEYEETVPFDISFAIPDKDFIPPTTKKPAIDCYLYDITEDRDLKNNEQSIKRRPDGTFESTPPPVRVKLSYCITAWSPAKDDSKTGTDPAIDEHRLLSDVLKVLLKYPVLPPQVLAGSLKNQEVPPPTTVLLPNGIKNPGDFWNAIGGQLRPCLDYGVTISLDYREAVTGATVTTKAAIFSQSGEPFSSEDIIQIGGRVYDSSEPPGPVIDAQVMVEETGRTVKSDQTGCYTVGHLAKGEYTFRVRAQGFHEKRLKVRVPAPGDVYDFKLEHE